MKKLEEGDREDDDVYTLYISRELLLRTCNSLER
jgi:hypothetical protein